jgi:Xaa-Pro dipeptidase
VLTPETLPQVQALLSELHLDGWLLYDFRGRNPIAAAVLGDWIVGTRRVFVLLPRIGPPHALVHEIDAELWGHWPSSWTKSIWVYQSDLERLLEQHIRGQELAVEYSPHGHSPYLDCVPVGVFDFLWNYAADLASSADLVTRFLSVWTEADQKSHERAAAKIAEIAREGRPQWNGRACGSSHAVEGAPDTTRAPGEVQPLDDGAALELVPRGFRSS